jgi:hypothetical protein
VGQAVDLFYSKTKNNCCAGSEGGSAGRSDKCCGSDEGKGERKRLWSVIKRQRNGPKIIRQYAAYNTREKKGGNIVTNSVDSSVFLKIRAT